MTVLIALWAWLQTRLATARRGEDGWGAVEWMVIMVFVVGLAYGANEASRIFLDERISDLMSNN